ncbi:unnamed protein product [Porites evermanni]|uniref:Serpin domain-containing protein n=1 Tax=Porites evermanni TaxID=104178 RepID=A0ABN8LSD5_9CNID|nr:unnamed protein product [Porites evermanni]
MLSSDTRLVLVNAIYFKGLWLQPFLKEESFPGTFFVAANQKVQVQMMRQEAHFKFFESKELGCQILEMPYIGSKMSMVIFLPVETDGLGSLEGKIAYDNFKKSLSTLDSSRPEEMEVFLPKFKLTQQFSLNDVLSKMGASEMFIAGKADFSGITADSLYVSEVVHKAFIEVNEEGTEAAAATGIGVNALSLKPMFNADHPFLFFIRHNDIGAILFMGRLLKPRPAIISTMVFLKLYFFSFLLSVLTSHGELVRNLSVAMVADLFDAIEMMDNAMEYRDQTDKAHDISIIFLTFGAVITIIVSSLQMAEYEFIDGLARETNKEQTIKYKPTVVRNIFVLVINLVVMIARLKVVTENGKTRSTLIIFKNFIAIIFSKQIIQMQHNRIKNSIWQEATSFESKELACQILDMAPYIGSKMSMISSFL